MKGLRSKIALHLRRKICREYPQNSTLFCNYFSVFVLRRLVSKMVSMVAISSSNHCVPNTRNGASCRIRTFLPIQDTRRIRVFPLKDKNNLRKFASIFHYPFTIFTDSFTDSGFFCLVSQSEIGKAGVVVGTTTQRPMIFPLVVIYREVIDACDTAVHESMLAKLPVFVSVRTEPVAGIVMPLIGKSNGDTVAVKCPKFFDEAVI
jgi:hypothetical protein